MTSILDRVADVATKLILSSTTVTAAADAGPTFRRIELDGGAASWSPGCKVQARVRGATFRTFTPFGWTEDRRSVSLLVHRHPEGLATDWVDGLLVGDEVQLFGPRRSLALDDVTDAPIVVGDETSFALAAAWAGHGATPALTHLFEVTSTIDSRITLDALGLDAELIARRDDDAHHPDLVERVVELVAADPGATLVLTGKAQSIRAIRGGLKDAGLSPAVKVKAYWDPNRSGMD